MDLNLIVAVAIQTILILTFIYILVQIRDCQKIIKSMLRISKKYIKEVVTK